MPFDPPPTAHGPIRVALVEDDEAFRQTLVASIAAAPEMALCAGAAARARALRMLEQAPADVQVVDLGLLSERR